MPTDHDLADAYEAAWNEWDASGEAQLWEVVVTDGLGSTDGSEHV